MTYPSPYEYFARIADARALQACVPAPIGCGRSIPSLATGFRDQMSRDEYDVSGMCQACQDQVFAPSADEIAEMAANPGHYGRCEDCGEYRAYEFVDVGVGVMRGFDCCDPFGREPKPPRCTRTPGCELGMDHYHSCST